MWQLGHSEELGSRGGPTTCNLENTSPGSERVQVLRESNLKVLNQASPMTLTDASVSA